MLRPKKPLAKLYAGLLRQNSMGLDCLILVSNAMSVRLIAVYDKVM